MGQPPPPFSATSSIGPEGSATKSGVRIARAGRLPLWCAGKTGRRVFVDQGAIPNGPRPVRQAGADAISFLMTLLFLMTLDGTADTVR